MSNGFIWQVKVAARIHDPAEKALVLLRDPEGHEGGTSRALARLLALVDEAEEVVGPGERDGFSAKVFGKGIGKEIYEIVRRADHWAAAADRPQWPMEQVPSAGVYRPARWAQVRWTEEPVLIHPLSGREVRIEGGLRETELGEIKKRSLDHFVELLKKVGWETGDPDWRRIALVLWRFGPELVEDRDSGELGELWRLLPADTRVPDHSIWEHLDLASAFAGAFAADPNGEAALLAFSLGPVQSFIEAARKTDDLWAGSHLLARLMWEAAKAICEELGPDAIIFPRLRGIALVDLWLRDSMGLPDELFADCPWKGAAPDENPLFAATLPNRFVAIVPASRMEELARNAEESARGWLSQLGMRVVDRLLEVAGLREPGSWRDESIPAYEQMRRQLDGFPEVYWAGVSFGLARESGSGRSRVLDTSDLQQVMAPFYGCDPSQRAGFLATSAFALLSREIDLGSGLAFYAPNPGVLYPAFYELAERLLAAAKSVRPFGQSRQEGWRCSLTGEAEWLTTDRAHLMVPAGKRKFSGDADFRPGEHSETLWSRIAHFAPRLARSGEHLSALPAIKRLWPELFAEEVAGETGGIKQRFVVSTHTMALAAHLDRWLRGPERATEEVEELKRRLDGQDRYEVALPRRLLRQYKGVDPQRFGLAKKIPGYLDELRERDDEATYQRACKLVAKVLGLGDEQENEARLETYYALLMMDGDRMGEILSGARSTIKFKESFHPQVREGFEQQAKAVAELAKYGDEQRPVSPSRHVAISGALNDFSQVVVPFIVEEQCNGRLIYAGGDDVLAMLPVAEVLEAMGRLRWAYSGEFPGSESEDWKELRRKGRLVAKNGFVYLDGRLMRMMGTTATASCGVVIAHYQAPLSFVLRQLREAEQKAKRYKRPASNDEKKTKTRDAFHITVIKRSGGTLHLSGEWGKPLKLLGEFRDLLSDEAVSRRAVYNTLAWLDDVPAPSKNDDELLKTLLAYQFSRQVSSSSLKGRARHLVKELVELAVGQGGDVREWLRNFLTVADFLAREVRA